MNLLKLLPDQHLKRRVLVMVLCMAGLAMVYLLQRIDFLAFTGYKINQIEGFLLNRFVRFLLNDFLMLTIIFQLFLSRRYLLFAIYVQVVGFLFLLLPYFLLKLYYPGYNGAMINYLHRIIINPTLLIMLIPALFYQQFLKNNRPRL